MTKIVLAFMALLQGGLTIPAQVANDVQAPSFRVSGTVAGLSNQPMRDTRIVLTALGSFTGFESRIASDGSFDMQKVPAGSYTVMFNPAVIGAAGIDIRVSDRDIAGIRMVVPIIVRVTGQFLVDQGGPLPTILPLEFVGGTRGYSATVDAQGKFTATVPSGDYEIRTERTQAKPGALPHGYSVKSITYAGKKLSGNRIRLVSSDDNTLVISLDTDSVKVHGRVTGMESVGPRSVSVIFVPAADSGLPRITAATSLDGMFEILRVPPGIYSVIVSPPLPGSMPKTVEIRGKDIRNLELTLPVAVDFKGRVLVEGGGPAPRFNVTILDTVPSVGTMALVREDQSFSFRLVEGEHRLRVDVQNAAFELKSFKFGASDAQGKALRYSASTKDEFELRLVAVTPPGGWHRVSGRIVGGENLLPISKHIVVAGVGATTGVNLDIEPNPDGTFLIPRLANGTYILRPSVPNTMVATGKTITVANSDIVGVEVPISGMITVHGTVRVENGGPIPPLMIFLRPLANSPVPASFSGIGSAPRTSVLSDGTITLTNPEGQYRVEILNLPAGYSVRSFTAGTVDLVRNVLTLSRSDIPNLELVVTPPSDLVWGRVSGKLIGAVPVAPDPPDRSLIRPENSQRYGGDVRFMSGKERIVLLTMRSTGHYETEIKPDGSFEFPAVLPGEYFLRLVPVSPDLQPERITVKAGDNLELQPVIKP